MGIADFFGKQQFCTHCGQVNHPKQITKGSLLIETFCWGLTVFLFLVMFPVGIVLAVIPGIFAIGYSLWRLMSRYTGCPACKQPGMIPTDSPVAQRLQKG